MSQLTCVHCQQPIAVDAPRRGNMVTCPSCKGQVYMPQVQRTPTAEERRATAAASPGSPKKNKRGYVPSGKKGMISANGMGITMIILCMLVVGGVGFGVGGHFVYRAIKDHVDKRKQLAQTQYNFEGSSTATTASAAPQGNSANDASKQGLFSMEDAGKPTRTDLEKLQRSFQAMVEISLRLDSDYKEDLTDVGLNRLLVADRIAADTDFKQSRQIIVAARQVIEKHKQIAKDEEEAFLRDLGKLKLEGIAAEVMVMRIRGVFQAAQPNADLVRGIDSAIASHYEQAINHLEETRGTWKLEGESVVFSRNKDAERYKMFFDEVDKCVQLQMSLSQRIGMEALPKYKAAFGL